MENEASSLRRAIATQELQRMRQILKRRLETHEDNAAVAAKYLWAAKQHNLVVAKFADVHKLSEATALALLVHVV
jgi:hypothetical protein